MGLFVGTAIQKRLDFFIWLKPSPYMHASHLYELHSNVFWVWKKREEFL